MHAGQGQVLGILLEVTHKLRTPPSGRRRSGAGALGGPGWHFSEQFSEHPRFLTTRRKGQTRTYNLG